MYKNIEKQTALELREQVDDQAGQIISRTLVQNGLMSMTLFAFEKGEEISPHAAGGDAMVTVLEGTGRFTVGGQEFLLHEGQPLLCEYRFQTNTLVRRTWHALLNRT